MKTKLLVLLTCCSATVLAQQQTIKIVTSDITTGPPAVGQMPGGGQPMKTGTGVIFGQVTEADSDRPVPGAIVSVVLPGSQPIRVMADGQGRFGFRQMPAGSFSVTATRSGWVDGAFGRTRPGGPTLPVALADGDRVSNVIIPMWRYATIAGTVMDETGDPVIGAPVFILKRASVGGRSSLKEVQMDATDDRGAYRASNLEPGDYVVVVPMQQPAPDLPPIALEAPRAEAMVVRAVSGVSIGGGGGNVAFTSSPTGAMSPAGIGDDGRPLSFATMFYPNATSSARAELITVASGEARVAIDFQLRAVPTSKISGTATGPDGIVPNLQITVVPAEADENATSIETLTGFSDGQGRFTIPGVPPGQYVLRATRMPKPAMMGNVVTATVSQGGQVMVSRMVTSNAPAAPLPAESTLWAEMTIGVGSRDVTDLAIGLRPGVKMSGLLQFNGSAPRPAPDTLGTSINVVLEPAESRQGLSNAAGRVDANGTFATVGVPPGRYFVRVKAGVQGWSLQSVMVNGRDASVVPVDIGSDIGGVQVVFTDQPSELSGQVTADGPVEAATVLIFPADATAWTGYGSQSRRLASARVDRQGRFKVTSLPAGDYLAIAMLDKMAGNWPDPRFLESLAVGATRLRVGDNEKVTTSLRVAR